MLMWGHYPISCSASSCTKDETQQRMEGRARDADHIWDPIRDGINVPAVWTRHRTLVYVNLPEIDCVSGNGFKAHNGITC